MLFGLEGDPSYTVIIRKMNDYCAPIPETKDHYKRSKEEPLSQTESTWVNERGTIVNSYKFSILSKQITL